MTQQDRLAHERAYDIEKPAKEVDFYGPDAGRFGKSIAQDTIDLMAEIRRLDLLEHVGELAIQGLTVIPPEKVASPEFIAKLRDKILEVAERRTGIRYDLEKAPAHPDPNAALGTVLLYILLEDPLFQQAAMLPAAMAMADFMVGKNAQVSVCDGLIKGAGTIDLTMHADHFMMPAPFPMLTNQINNFLTLTDLDEDNGATCYVPGSHLFRRQPMPLEGVEERVIVNARAGSLICWDGNLWHGAVGRKVPGVRVAMSTTLMRPHLRPFEDYRPHVTQEMLDRNPPRFRKLIGQHIGVGWTDPSGPLNDEHLTIGRHPYE